MADPTVSAGVWGRPATSNQSKDCSNAGHKEADTRIKKPGDEWRRRIWREDSNATSHKAAHDGQDKRGPKDGEESVRHVGLHATLRLRRGRLCQGKVKIGLSRNGILTISLHLPCSALGERSWLDNRGTLPTKAGSCSSMTPSVESSEEKKCQAEYTRFTDSRDGGGPAQGYTLSGLSEGSSQHFGGAFVPDNSGPSGQNYGKRRQTGYGNAKTPFGGSIRSETPPARLAAARRRVRKHGSVLRLDRLVGVVVGIAQNFRPVGR